MRLRDRTGQRIARFLSALTQPALGFSEPATLFPQCALRWTGRALRLGEPRVEDRKPLRSGEWEHAQLVASDPARMRWRRPVVRANLQRVDLLPRLRREPCAIVDTPQNDGLDSQALTQRPDD